MALSKEIYKTTCPRDCYDTCGIEVLRENGRIVSVRGDKEHFFSRGKLCGKCQIFYTQDYLSLQGVVLFHIEIQVSVWSNVANLSYVF